MADKHEIDKVAFESPVDRGFQVKAFYLVNSAGNALIELYRDGSLLREFLFPAYKIWNIAAHFSDIVDSEIADNTEGYAIAASTGLEFLTTPNGMNWED